MKNQAANLLLFRNQLFPGTPRRKTHTPQNQQGPSLFLQPKRQRKQFDGLDVNPMLFSQNQKAQSDLPSTLAAIKNSQHKNKLPQQRKQVENRARVSPSSWDSSISTKTMSKKIQTSNESRLTKLMIMRTSALNKQTSFKSPKVSSKKKLSQIEPKEKLEQVKQAQRTRLKDRLMQLKIERDTDFRVEVDSNLDLDANRKQKPAQPPSRHLFPANNQTPIYNRLGQISSYDLQSITVDSELDQFEERQDSAENEYGGLHKVPPNVVIAGSSPKLYAEYEQMNILTQPSPFSQRPMTTPSMIINQQQLESERKLNSAVGAKFMNCQFYDSYGNRGPFTLTTPNSMHNTHQSFNPQGSFKIVHNPALSTISSAKILNQELKQYFSNKKARKASSRRKYPTSQKKQVIPVLNLLWVESLNENLTHQLEKERLAEAAMQKYSIAKDCLKKPSLSSRQPPQNNLNTKCAGRSKSRNDNNIYGAPSKPLSELHKQLTLHQEQYQKTRNKDTATQPTLTTIQKSRASKLFQILTNDIGQGTPSPQENKQQVARHNSRNPGYENLRAHSNPIEYILKLTGKQMSTPGAVTKRSSRLEQRCDQKVRKNLLSTLQKPRMFILSDKLLSLKNIGK